MSSQAGISVVARRQLRVRRDDAELLLAREGPLAQRVPAVVELARVLVRPLRRHVVRRVRRTGREVGEERLVGHERLLLVHPGDRLVGHVAHEVVALLGRAIRLDRRRPLVERRVVLVRLAADEAVEVLEAAARRPVVERPHRARLPDRHLVALAELRGRVPVELEDLRQRRARVRAHRVVARRGRRDLRDPAHADRVVVATAQQRRAGRGAQGRRVEAVELQPAGRETLRVGRRARSAERARRAEPRVVDEHDEDVGRACRRPQLLDGRERGVRVLRVVGDQPRRRDVGHREDVAAGRSHVCSSHVRSIRLARRVGIIHLG